MPDEQKIIRDLTHAVWRGWTEPVPPGAKDGEFDLATSEQGS